MQMRRLGLGFNKINHIFLSHLHGDHVLGIFGLISTLNLLGRTKPLYIFAHPDFEPILKTNNNFFNNNLNFDIVFNHLNSNEVQNIFEDKKIIVTSIPLNHRVPTVGFIFREKEQPLNVHKYLIEHYNIGLADIVKIKNGADYVSCNGEVVPNSRLTYRAHIPRSYAYCSDTLFSERLIEQVKNVNLLYHEATFLQSEYQLAKQTGHSTALQAATVAKRANVDKLIIGHFSSRYTNTVKHQAEARSVFQNSFAVNDGDVYSVEERK